MKAIKTLLQVFVITVFILGLVLLGVGYIEYKEVLEERPLVEVVEGVKSRSSYVPLQDMGPYYPTAVVAIEDHRFYNHGALDLVGIMRALVQNIKAREVVQGGSTITQQLAKNLYFSNEQTLKRKVAEMFLAYEIEKNYSKDEILELYTNIIYFGRGSYGIGEASRVFFELEPSKLNLEQACFLAGLPQAPSIYEDHLELAQDRQKDVQKAYKAYQLKR